MNNINVNGKKYILESEANKIIGELERKLEIGEQERQDNKYKAKYEAVNKKYRSLYCQYKNQSDRNNKVRCKYLEIIHKLQVEIINQANIEDLISEAERMTKIEIEL